MDLRESLEFARIRTTRLTYSGFTILFIIALCGRTSNGIPDGTKIETGWTEVTEKWPLQESEFFIADKKGHHFIEVSLPNYLPGDLEVELQYYYQYESTLPTVVMAIKGESVPVFHGSTNQKRGEWLTHRVQVKRSDCLDNTFLYDILLHQRGDVFAWRKIKISFRPEVTTVQTETIITVPEETTSETSTIQNPTTSAAEIDSTTPKTSDIESITFPSVPNEQNDLSITTPRATDSTLQEDSTPGTELIIPQNENFENKPPSKPSNEPIPKPDDDFQVNNNFNRRLRRWIDPQDQQKSLLCKPSSCDKRLFKHPRFVAVAKGLPDITKNNLKDKKFYLNTEGKPLSFISSSSTRIDEKNPCINLELYMDEGTEMELSIPDNTSPSEKKTLEVVKPKVRDSSASKWEPFVRCASDYMPQLTKSNMKGEKLNFTFEPHSQRGGKIGVLVDMKKVVELREPFKMLDYVPNIDSLDEKSKNNFTRFWVLDNDGVSKAKYRVTSRGQSGEKVLKIVDIDPKQESFDITTRWIKVKNVETLENPLFFIYRADRADWVKSVDFQFQSASNPPDSWHSSTVYVEFNPISQSIKIPLIYDLNFPRKESLTVYNSFDRLSLSTPNLETTPSPDTTSILGEASSSQTHPSVATIASSQATKENPTSEMSATNPPVIVSSNPPLIASSPATEIVSTNTEQMTTQVTTGATTIVDTTTPSTDVVTISSRVPKASSRGQMEIPIKLKGLNSEEFRLRVRHNLKDGAKRSATNHELTISTLAFGDACVKDSFCLHNGVCQPTGSGTASCACKAGYSGDNCEIKKPCEVIYDGKTGQELCKSIGSNCIAELPNLRCVWPNDKYYQCKALYQKQDENLIPLPPDPNPPQLLQKRIEEQQRLIIILSVFMGALLLFSIVIIGNMITKLMKSKRRLKKAESDVHELTRRSVPGTSASSFGRLTGRNKAAAVVSYNNQAFDAE